MMEDLELDPEVARFWSELDQQFLLLLLNNVWCVACHKPTTIVGFAGKKEQGDIVLKGRCIRCDGPVARVLEGLESAV